MPDQIKFRGAAMDQLISQPMIAIVKANQMMANEQVKLLMKICFSKVDDVYEPVMIAMLMRRGGIEPGHDDQPTAISETAVRFQVPLITLLPINSLTIENVDIKFEMDIHTHYEVAEDDDKHLFGNLSSSPTKSHELIGNITNYQSRDKTTENSEVGGGISVSVATGNLPLPIGVNAIIQAYSKVIHPSDTSDI